MLVAGAGSVGADPGAVSRVGVAPNGFCPFLKSLWRVGVIVQLYLAVTALTVGCQSFVGGHGG